MSEELLTSSLHHLGEEEATDKMLVVNEMSVVYKFYETTFWKYLKRQTCYCMRRTVTRMQKEVIACAKRMLQYSLCKAGAEPCPCHAGCVGPFPAMCLPLLSLLLVIWNVVLEW